MTDAEIIKALECCAGDDGCDVCPMYKPSSECITELQGKALDLINRQKAEIERLQHNNTRLEANFSYLQKTLAEKNAKIEALQMDNAQIQSDNINANMNHEHLQAEIENQSENFKVLTSDHRTLQQSFDNLKGLYEAEKIKVAKAKEKCIGFAKELQTAKAELKETTEKFNCQQYVYTDLSDIIKEKNAEIEKLQADNSSMQSTLAKMSMGVAEARAEAIKEFEEKLKEKAFADKYYEHESIVYLADIDNLVKEMVGEG